MKRDITILSISLVLILAVVNLPARWFSVSHWFSEPSFGTVALTDITGSDSLSAYPTTQNANNTILENALNSIIGTTTISTLTTASSLATVGTITTGTWNADTLSVAYGGTGTTTISQYSVLLGSTTNALGIVDGLGTSGQFLTSQGTGLPPQWTTGSVDTSLDRTWTGHNIFSSIFMTLASSTQATTTTGYITDGTIDTLTTSDCTGCGFDLYATTTVAGFNSADATTNTVFTTTLPANSLQAGQVFEVGGFASTTDQAGGSSGITTTIRLTLGTTAVDCTDDPGDGNTVQSQWYAKIISTGTATQRLSCYQINDDNTVIRSTTEGTETATGALTLKLEYVFSGTNADRFGGVEDVVGTLYEL